MLRIPSYTLIVASVSTATVVGYAIGTWNPSFLIRAHGLSLREAGLLMGVGGGLVSAVGTLWCGALTDRLAGRDRGRQLGTALRGTFLLLIPCLCLMLAVPRYRQQAGNDAPVTTAATNPKPGRN